MHVGFPGGWIEQRIEQPSRRSRCLPCRSGCLPRRLACARCCGTPTLLGIRTRPACASTPLFPALDRTSAKKSLYAHPCPNEPPAQLASAVPGARYRPTHGTTRKSARPTERHARVRWLRAQRKTGIVSLPSINPSPTHTPGLMSLALQLASHPGFVLSTPAAPSSPQAVSSTALTMEASTTEQQPPPPAAPPVRAPAGCSSSALAMITVCSKESTHRSLPCRAAQSDRRRPPVHRRRPASARPPCRL